MRIIVNSGKEPKIDLRLPAGLLFNGLTAKLVCGFLDGKGVSIPGGQMNRLFHELARYRKTHPDWTLVEVDSANGEHMNIVI